MTGFTRKRGSTWTAYWEGPRDAHTGKRRQRTKGGFERRKDAQRFLTTTLAAINDGSYAEPSKTPLARFLIDEWLPAIASAGKVRPLTVDRYGQCARRVARDEIGDVPLCNLSAAHIDGFTRRVKGKGLSDATLRLTYATLRRALNYAVSKGKLARNPVDRADSPPLPRSRAKSWTNRELRTFLEHVREDRLYALWRLAATTGMRRGELLGLSWRTLDLDAATLRVERQLLEHPKRGTMFGPPKSHRSERTIALDPATVAALRERHATQLLERQLAGEAYGDQDLVFCDELGGPISPTRLSVWFVKARKAAGIPVGTLHTLRHTAATIALTEGVPLHVVAARLGDDPRTVLGTYAHLLPHSDAQAAAAVAAVLADKREHDKPLTNEPPAPVVTGDSASVEQI